MSNQVIIDYTNHLGDRAARLIEPVSMHFEENNYHEGVQWFLRAKAVDRNNEFRMFAMKDIHSWRPALTRASCETVVA